jgi:glycosyltransferase involved in cell wall biosynthesis
MKKIIFLVTQSEFGGAQRYIFEVVSSLDKGKYEVLVAAGEGDGELFRKVKDLSIKTAQLKWLKRTPWPWQVVFSIFEILNLLKREGPDVLFLCSTTAGLLGSAASFLFKNNLRVIYRIGGWSFLDPRPSWQNKILLWLEKLTVSFKDKIIVNSEFDRNMAMKYKICSPEKIVKIHNGINVNKFNFLSKEEARNLLLQKIASSNLQTADYVIGTVANFYKTKGLKYLIEAIYLIDSKNKLPSTNYKLLIIGEGHQRPQLESLIEKYNLQNRVFLLGRIPNAYRYLKAFDIFVLPSLKEGFPWIVLETIASGVPVIATNVGALPEIIEDEKEGFLIELKNPEMITERILKLLQNEQLSQNLTNLAKEKLRKFSLQKMIEETEKLL